MERSIRRRAPLVALALAAPLMLSSSATESTAGEAGTGSSPEPLSCEMPKAADLARHIQAGPQMVPDDGSTVVLNGRGYNYGAAEEEPLDRMQIEGLMNQIEIERR